MKNPNKLLQRTIQSGTCFAKKERKSAPLQIAAEQGVIPCGLV